MTAAVQHLPAGRNSALTSEIVNVTPTMAEKWLGKNTKNRNVRKLDVARYARAMQRGEWLLTGEAIKFGVDGTLLDGQHRLLAVIEAGKAVKIMVIRGLAADAQDVLDTGVGRKAADQLHIHGHSNSALLAASAKIAILWESSRFYVDSKKRHVSHREILDFVDGNHLLVIACSSITQVRKAADLRPSVAAMAKYELLKVDDDKAAEFFDRITDGVNLPAGSPILALRSRLRSIKDERAQLPNEVLVSMVFRTWNAWRDGRPMMSLPLIRDGQYIHCPEPK